MKPPMFSKVMTTLVLAVLGAGYFTTFSQMNLPWNLENYLILVPVQLGVLAYFFLRKSTSKDSD